MSERERLVELIGNISIGGIPFRARFYKSAIEKIADQLLESGAIVPTVKVGQTVYHLGYSFKVEEIEILQNEIFYRCGNTGTDDYMAFCESDIGKTVFLTKEEAEKALKGGAE